MKELLSYLYKERNQNKNTYTCNYVMEMLCYCPFVEINQIPVVSVLQKSPQ